MGKWQIDPPCKAELYLEKLFSSKKIGPNDTPLKVQKDYPIFMDFSAAVFRNNFKRYRERSGLGLVKYSNQEADDLEANETDCSNTGGSSVAVKDEKIVELISLKTTNSPFLMAMYKKPDCLDEVIMILLPLTSGVTNVRFNVSEDGTEAYIRFNWPTPMYNIASIVKKDNGREVPKILALQEQLVNHRNAFNEAPEGKVTIKLPVQVQTNISDHVVIGIEDKEGGKYLQIELPALKKQYAQGVIEVKFEK